MGFVLPYRNLIAPTNGPLRFTPRTIKSGMTVHDHAGDRHAMIGITADRHIDAFKLQLGLQFQDAVDGLLAQPALAASENQLLRSEPASLPSTSWRR